jgi:hypothetical protein
MARKAAYLMTKQSATKPKPKAKIKRKAKPVRASQPAREPAPALELAGLVAEFGQLTTKIDEVLHAFSDRLDMVEMKLDALVAIANAMPVERDEDQPRRNGVIRHRSNLFG